MDVYINDVFVPSLMISGAVAAGVIAGSGSREGSGGYSSSSYIDYEAVKKEQNTIALARKLSHVKEILVSKYKPIFQTHGLEPNFTNNADNISISFQNKELCVILNLSISPGQNGKTENVNIHAGYITENEYKKYTHTKW